MKTDLIKIKKLESIDDLELLSIGDVVIISVGSGQVNDFKEYHGHAMFLGEKFKERQHGGFDFCRRQANLGDCLVGYHIDRQEISVTEEGVISAKEFSTYGTKYPALVRSSNLI